MDFLEKLKRANYDYVGDIRVLDASEFGVPQRRKRVFILAAQKGLPLPAYPVASEAPGDGLSGMRFKTCPNIDRCKYLYEDDVYRGPFWPVQITLDFCSKSSATGGQK
jgi:site-specific DNA-cytosine methylase